MSDWQVITGDCLDVMPTLAADSVDTIITDPPYGLSFMGKDWDHGIPGPRFWVEALRVAKPGAMLLAFGGSRTFHRLAVAIEDAGWEIRDTIMWVYGSGFPKSHDISKAIDKAAGVEPIITGETKRASIQRNGTGETWNRGAFASHPEHTKHVSITAPATPAAQEWSGYGTAAKPAHEPVIIARKPLPIDAEPSIIVANLFQLEVQLWLLLRVLTAETPSTLSQAEYAEALNTAQWNADEPGNILADLQGQMAMSQLELAITTTLNTVSSWRNTWEEALRHGSTFTIETATSQIIDLKTLSYSALALTPQDIIRDAITQPGPWWNASSAASVLNVAARSLIYTLERFAVESAIESGRIPSPDAIDKTVLSKPIIVAMKPLDGTFAQNAQRWGVAGMWIDGGRVGTGEDKETGGCHGSIFGNNGKGAPVNSLLGRWPANVIHDGSAEVLAGFPVTTSGGQHYRGEKNGNILESFSNYSTATHSDTGSAARFFYTAKASRSERNAGLEGMEAQPVHPSGNQWATTSMWNGENGDEEWRKKNPNNPQQNHHPTVKPLALMRYLARLTKTPTGGVVLDPFAGSGSTGCAAVLEGRSFIGIEQDAEYADIARRRIDHWQEQGAQLELI